MMRFNWLQSTFTAARPQESQSENANLRAEVSRLMSDIEYRDAEIERLNLGFRKQQTRIDELNANAHRLNSMSGEVERLLACVSERDVLIGELNDKILCAAELIDEALLSGVEFISSLRTSFRTITEKPT